MLTTTEHYEEYLGHPFALVNTAQSHTQIHIWLGFAVLSAKRAYTHALLDMFEVVCRVYDILPETFMYEIKGEQPRPGRNELAVVNPSKQKDGYWVYYDLPCSGTPVVNKGMQPEEDVTALSKILISMLARKTHKLTSKKTSQ